jgi:hypothetical protein
MPHPAPLGDSHAGRLAARQPENLGIAVGRRGERRRVQGLQAAGEVNQLGERDLAPGALREVGRLRLLDRFARPQGVELEDIEVVLLVGHSTL